jgi:hypothetical protein
MVCPNGLRLGCLKRLTMSINVWSHWIAIWHLCLAKRLPWPASHEHYGVENEIGQELTNGS